MFLFLGLMAGAWLDWVLQLVLEMVLVEEASLLRIKCEMMVSLRRIVKARREGGLWVCRALLVLERCLAVAWEKQDVG